jgi:hypothetical protein
MVVGGGAGGLKAQVRNCEEEGEDSFALTRVEASSNVSGSTFRRATFSWKPNTKWKVLLTKLEAL